MRGVKIKRKSFLGYEDPYDYYDPIEEGSLEETDSHYIIKNGLYDYHVPKEDVIGEPEWYDLDGVLGEI